MNLILTRQKIIGFLVLSLALNLFFIGIFSAKWFFHHHDYVGRFGTMKRMAMAAEQLEPKIKQQVITILEQQGPAIHTAMLSVRYARQTAQHALTAEMFNHEQTKQAMSELTHHSQAVKEQIHAVMLAVAAVLPYKERQLYFEQLHKKRKRKLSSSLPLDDQRSQLNRP